MASRVCYQHNEIRQRSSLLITSKTVDALRLFTRRLAVSRLLHYLDLLWIYCTVVQQWLAR